MILSPVKGIGAALIAILVIVLSMTAQASTNSGFDSTVSPNIFAVKGQAAITVNEDTDPSHNPPQPSVNISGPIVEGSTTIATDGSTTIGSSTNPAPLVVNGKVGVGTMTPQGTLDVENSTRNATLCINGSCTTSLPQVIGGSVIVSGCGQNNCGYSVYFSRAFPSPPSSVTCSAGPNAQSGWGSLSCQIQAIYNDHVDVTLDGCSNYIDGNNKYIGIIGTL